MLRTNWSPWSPRSGTSAPSAGQLPNSLVLDESAHRRSSSSHSVTYKPEQLLQGDPTEKAAQFYRDYDRLVGLWATQGLDQPRNLDTTRAKVRPIRRVEYNSMRRRG